MLWFLGLGACGILVPWSGIEPHSLAWKAKSESLDHQGRPPVALIFNVNAEKYIRSENGDDMMQMKADLTK